MVDAASPNFDQSSQDSPTVLTPVRSLRELLDRVTGKGFKPPTYQEEAGVVDVMPFPFFGLVGQQEMKVALILALINPRIGGVLLIGPRGTGKTTAVRSLGDLLPDIGRSLCYYGCLPEDIEKGGLEAVCPDCAQRYGRGEPLAIMDRIHLIELPLNARLEDVVGGIDERPNLHQRLRLRRGILSMADRNILYVDEVNLLADDIIDALLDASAQGRYVVRRGPVGAVYNSRFILFGSMNPEEGKLRPQIQDRFGLRVIVSGLSNSKDRMEAYRRVQAYLQNPHYTLQQFSEETANAREDIQAARQLLPRVVLPENITETGLSLIKELQIDSLRAEITLFEAVKAYAAADGRTIVEMEDLIILAPMALRLRRSKFMSDYLTMQGEEEKTIKMIMDDLLTSNSTIKEKNRRL